MKLWEQIPFRNVPFRKKIQGRLGIYHTRDYIAKEVQEYAQGKVIGQKPPKNSFPGRLFSHNMAPSPKNAISPKNLSDM